MKNMLFALALLVLQCAPVLAVTCLPGFPPDNPDHAYALHGDGTVTDTRFGLMWKQCSEGQVWVAGACTGGNDIHSWSDALIVAEGAVFAGHSDWRLPNLKELYSLVEGCRQSLFEPAINDAIFPDAPAISFWTSSPSWTSWPSGNPGGAWHVRFSGAAEAYSGSRSDAIAVRLVRDNRQVAFP